MNDRGISVRLQAPLARHTPWRTGGPCEAMVWIHSRDRLLDALAELRSTQSAWSVMGAGTRSVVRDGGISGLVLRLGVDFARIRPSSDEPWEVGAAAPMPALARRATAPWDSGKHAFSGLEGA